MFVAYKDSSQIARSESHSSFEMLKQGLAIVNVWVDDVLDNEELLDGADGRTVGRRLIQEQTEKGTAETRWPEKGTAKPPKKAHANLLWASLTLFGKDFGDQWPKTVVCLFWGIQIGRYLEVLLC